jgi:hypothetical protein
MADPGDGNACAKELVSLLDFLYQPSLALRALRDIRQLNRPLIS